MKKLLVILMLITCTFAMQGCNNPFSYIKVKNNTLTYGGNVYVFLEGYEFRYNRFSPMTQVGWTDYTTYFDIFPSFEVFTFDDDIEENFIYVDGYPPRIGVNKEYNMTPLFECQVNQIWVSGKSKGYKDIEVMGFDQLVNFETSVERTSSFNNSFQYNVYVIFLEYPFLSYMFSIFLVEGKYIMDVVDSHLNQTFYPIYEEYYYLFEK